MHYMWEFISRWADKINESLFLYVEFISSDIFCEAGFYL